MNDEEMLCDFCKKNMMTRDLNQLVKTVMLEFVDHSSFYFHDLECLKKWIIERTA